MTPDGKEIPMEETKVFEQNTFGLKTLYNEGRIGRDTIDGWHL
jgi:hypothetical protein